jgi:hypothetical protein
MKHGDDYNLFIVVFCGHGNELSGSIKQGLSSPLPCGTIPDCVVRLVRCLERGVVYRAPSVICNSPKALW